MANAEDLDASWTQAGGAKTRAGRAPCPVWMLASRQPELAPDSLLVALAAPDRDRQSAFGLLHVFGVERHQLAATEAAGEAH